MASCNVHGEAEREKSSDTEMKPKKEDKQEEACVKRGEKERESEPVGQRLRSWTWVLNAYMLSNSISFLLTTTSFGAGDILPHGEPSTRHFSQVMGVSPIS